MSNYPAGAINDSSAPYNEQENKPVTIKYVASETLWKEFVSDTQDYELDGSEIKYDAINYYNEFNRDNYLPSEVMKLCRTYLLERIKVLTTIHTPEAQKEKSIVARIIQQLDGWEQSDYIIERD